MTRNKVIQRPVHFFLSLLVVLFIVDLFLYFTSLDRQEKMYQNGRIYDVVTSGLGLTDLCVSTEARYTRHPAVSDPMAPFMDHPGAVEHFPSGSFWAPPGFMENTRKY